MVRGKINMRECIMEKVTVHFSFRLRIYPVRIPKAVSFQVSRANEKWDP